MEQNQESQHSVSTDSRKLHELSSTKHVLYSNVASYQQLHHIPAPHSVSPVIPSFPFHLYNSCNNSYNST